MKKATRWTVRSLRRHLGNTSHLPDDVVLGMCRWADRYYSVPPASSMSWYDAALHSLNKWRGHKTRGSFPFDANTCALCAKSFAQSPLLYPCIACPLFKHLDGRSCAAVGQPYDVFDDTGDARPMLRALNAVVRKLRASRSKATP
jgi:hypothetical protein